MENIELIEIENRIFTIRGVQVMLDRHLAEMYKVDTKRLNEQVKRNLDRFPESFRFQLTNTELENLRLQFANRSEDSLRSQFATLNQDPLRFQIGTLNKGRGQHRKYIPYVFTEQGVAMLSAVLHSETAVKVSIRIMHAFVEMRKMVLGNAALFQRLDRIEFKQLETDHQFEQVFKALESREQLTEKGIFYDGQVFNAWIFISDLIRSAKQSLILIDNYVDYTVLNLITSLKDLGKKWFAFSKLDAKTPEMLNLLKIKINE